jgi:hypothetical protein
MNRLVCLAILTLSSISFAQQQETQVEVGHRVDLELGDSIGLYGRAGPLLGKKIDGPVPDGSDISLKLRLIESEEDYLYLAKLSGEFSVTKGPANFTAKAALMRKVIRQEQTITFVLTIQKRFTPQRAAITTNAAFAKAVTDAINPIRFIEDHGYGAITSVTPAAGIHLVYQLRFSTNDVFKQNVVAVKAGIPGLAEGKGRWEDFLKKFGKFLSVSLDIEQVGAADDVNIITALRGLTTLDPYVLQEAALKAVAASKRNDAAVVAYTVTPWTLIAPKLFEGNEALRATINQAGDVAEKLQRARFKIALQRLRLEELQLLATTLDRGMLAADLRQYSGKLDDIEKNLSPKSLDSNLPPLPQLVLEPKDLIKDAKITWRFTEQRRGEVKGLQEYRVNMMPNFVIQHAELIEFIAVQYDGLPLFDDSKDSLFVTFYGIKHADSEKQLPRQEEVRYVALVREMNGSQLEGKTGPKTGPVNIELDMPFNWLVNIATEAYNKPVRGNTKAATVHTWEAVREGMTKVKGKLLLKVRGVDKLVAIDLPDVPKDLGIVSR